MGVHIYMYICCHPGILLISLRCPVTDRLSLEKVLLARTAVMRARWVFWLPAEHSSGCGTSVCSCSLLLSPAIPDLLYLNQVDMVAMSVFLSAIAAFIV